MGNQTLEKAKAVCTTLQGIGISTLYKMAKSGEIPSYKVGKRGVRFVVEEVKSALLRQTDVNDGN